MNFEKPKKYDFIYYGACYGIRRNGITSNLYIIKKKKKPKSWIGSGCPPK